MPTRALHPNEEFTLTLEANTQAAALKEWLVPIFYDTDILICPLHPWLDMECAPGD